MLYDKIGNLLPIQNRVRKLSGIDAYYTPFHMILYRAVYDLMSVSLTNCHHWHQMANECEECLILADVFLEGDDEE